MIVVSNTTPLIGLAVIDQFHLLQALFGKINIPQAVYNEVVVAGKTADGAKQQVAQAAWINIVTIQDQLAVNVLLDELDQGEAETIILSQELKADWVLMDEKKGRRKLTQMGVQKIGTVGILLKAKQLGILPVVRPHLKALREKGFSISQPVIDAVLQQANEQ